jgi:hypothetical protein
MAEPSELFRLNRASHRYPGDTNSTHFRRNNSDGSATAGIRAVGLFLQLQQLLKIFSG